MVLDRGSKKHKETQGYTKEDLLDLSMQEPSCHYGVAEGLAEIGSQCQSQVLDG